MGLTKKQIMISRIILGALLLLCALFLLIASLLGLSFVKMLFITALFYVSAALLLLAFVQKNTLLLWLSGVFIVAFAVLVLVGFTSLGYKNCYPLYILSPAVGSFITMFYSKECSSHLKVINLFAPLSAIFMLSSFFGLPLKIVLPLGCMYLAIFIIVYSIYKSRKA